MARPNKTGLDYFPFNVVDFTEIEILEAKHGLVGYSILIKLYQKIYSNGYWFNINKNFVYVFIKRVNVNINSFNEIINSCLDLGIFDRNIYEEYQILTSKTIQEIYFEAIKRRKKIKVFKEIILIDINQYINNNSVIVNIYPVNADINLINANIGTQSKVKESKVKESKEIPQSVNVNINSNIKKQSLEILRLSNKLFNRNGYEIDENNYRAIDFIGKALNEFGFDKVEKAVYYASKTWFKSDTNAMYKNCHWKILFRTQNIESLYDYSILAPPEEKQRNGIYKTPDFLK